MRNDYYYSYCLELKIKQMGRNERYTIHVMFPLILMEAIIIIYYKSQFINELYQQLYTVILVH